jgi:hypothetical protein
MEGFVDLPEFPLAGDSNASRGDQASVTALRAELAACLDKTESQNEVVDFSCASNTPNPGLHLKYAGGIGLPLSDNDARTIIAASRPTPLGQADETTGNKALRRIWEIHAGDFETRNPTWQRYIQKMAITASVKLGIVDVDARVAGVSAELYKLSLYEKGGSFESPRWLVLHLIQL